MEPHSKVLIIGSGVIGLTTAYLLLEKGFGVIIVAKEFPSTRRLPQIASEAAGALCVPPAMMNSHRVALECPGLLETYKRWSAYGEERYTPLATDAKITGVYLKEVVAVLPDDVDQATLKQYKQLRGFRHSPLLLKEKGLSDSIIGRKEDVFSFVGLVIDSPKFGTWLMQQHKFLLSNEESNINLTDQGVMQLRSLISQCIRKGAHLILGAIRGLLIEQAEILKMTYGVQFIVNCSGLGSVELAGDNEMFPVRGALLKARNDGTLFPKIDFCVEGKWTSFGVDEAGHQVPGHPYIYTRGEDHIMLGSLTQPNSSDPNVPFSAPYVQSMLSKCKDLCPRLHALKDSDLQVTVGIRPGREQIRVEQDPDDSSVFHNYGHYRWGMTLNWGSAADIVNLIDKEFKTNFRQSQLTTNKRLHLAKL